MSLYDRQLAKQDLNYFSAQRQRCKTDMLFLGRLLGYSRLNDRVHGPVAALCVKKDNTKPIEAQDTIKERIHLDPRGCFKTTFSVIDSVQWIINFPDVRICKVTATKPLAQAIVGEIAGHFTLDAGQEPSDFLLLFPEFAIPPRSARVGGFICPCRTQQWREDTVMAFSVETSFSGYHFDIFDPDDVVNTQNSKNDFGIARVKQNYYTDRKTLMPWGYVNYKGTRYAPSDLAGDLLIKAKPSRTKTLIRSALKLRSGERLHPGEFPPEEDIELLFPELLDYDYLKSEFDSDYASFMSQYMNDSHGGREVVFSPELVDSATLVTEQLPYIGERYVSWRLPCPARDMRRAGGVMGVINGNRMFIMDAATMSGAPSLIAEQMITTVKRFGVHRVDIEMTPGWEAFAPVIDNASLVENWPVTVNWLEPDRDPAARDIRIRTTEPLLKAKRLVIDESIRNLREVRNQLFNYGSISSTELVDTLSRVTAHLPASIIYKESLAEQRAWEELRERDLHDRVYGLGIYARQMEMVAEPEEEEIDTFEPPYNENFPDDPMVPGLYV